VTTFAVLTALVVTIFVVIFVYKRCRNPSAARQGYAVSTFIVCVGVLCASIFVVFTHTAEQIEV
jgi:FtsH-binding integral membrane protein